MNGHNQPTCWIIAGPNGAGKTTFALKYLPEVAGCRNFVNADLIAAGMAPLAPERERVAASRLFLREICFLNSGESPEIVFTRQGENREVKQPAVMQLLQRWRRP